MEGICRRVRGLVLGSSLVMAGCVTPGYVINSPLATGPCIRTSGPDCDVTLNVSWTGVSVHPFPDSTALDGATSTPNWTSATRSVEATLQVPTGAHTISVQGLLSDGSTIRTYSATQAFTIGDLTLTATPDPLVITGASTGTLTVNATLSGGIAPPISVEVTGLPANVSTSGAPASIPASGGTALITFQSAALAIAKVYTVTLKGAAGTTTSSKGFSLTLKPTLTSLTPAAPKRGDTVTLNGTNFDPNCANDRIEIAGVTLTPVASSCTATSVQVVIPFTAASGPTSAVVTVNGQSTAALAMAITPTEVIVAGSPTSFSFAVIDATTPARLSVVNVPSGIGGTVVSCSGNVAAIGSASSGVGKVFLVDLTNPSNPIPGAPFTTNFTQLGAIAFDGTHVLAGDALGSQVAVLQRSGLTLSQVSRPSTGILGISSAAIGGTFGLVAGSGSSTVDVIGPLSGTPPALTTFNPTNGMGLSADLSGTTAAIGSKGSGMVKVVNASTGNVLGARSTTLGSVDAISISGAMVAAGSSNASSMFLINFTIPSSPQLSAPITQTPAGGWTVALNGSPMHLIAGNQTGFDVRLLSIATGAGGVPAATLVSSATTSVANISSLCVTTF
jgi:hypothetical protein